MSVKLDDTQPQPATHYAQQTLDYPQEPVDEGRNGCGCFWGALLTAFVVTLLVIIGLFLPPIDLYNRLFGTQYAMLTADANAISGEGLTLVADAADVGEDFGTLLSWVSRSDFMAGNSQAASWVPAAQAAVPPYLALQSPVYELQTTGVPPRSMTLSVDVPTAALNPDILDLYAWDSETGEWHFIPAHYNGAGAFLTTIDAIPEYIGLFQATPLSPEVLASVDVTQVLSDDVGKLATIVAPAGMQPTLEGLLAGNPAPGFTLNAGYRVMPIIRNFADPRALDTETVAAVLSNSAVRSQHALQIATFVSSGGYDGVFIDYRELPPEQRANFTAFIRELRANLAGAERTLGVVVPAARNIDGVWDTGAYDWRALGEYADLIQIDFGLDPTIFAPGETRLVEAMLRWTVGEVSRYKLLLGLSAQSIREAGGDFTTIGFNAALAALGDVTWKGDRTQAGTVPQGEKILARLDGLKGIAGLDTLVQSPFIDYQTDDGATVARMWLTTGDALRYRMDKTVTFGLGGVAFDDLLVDDLNGDVFPAILNYKLQIPSAPLPTELALRWRVEGVDGVIDEVTTELNEELVVTIAAPDGNYAINVAVVGADGESPRTGAQVAVFAPTQTPTPLPTATFTPTPTLTPTPVPVVPTTAPTAPTAQAVAPSSSANANPAPPPSGSIGSFEYGGHVSSTSTGAASQMRQAGMTWMKVQIRYGIGANPSIAAGPINEAHGAGFKILLGIVGYPNELAAGGDGYINDYASFLGGVAALGPDAIEVWNEQNIDREWPTGQISGATYASMLSRAYQAIKSSNSSVMVISGAPAPTGAEGAYPGQVVNDDRFLSDFVNAGGLQYTDCLGAHYNEGIVGPSQTSGDPRDNYYTRYFWGMVNTYWNISGGQKPICFTELGYLTPEGYPPLDPYFGWASGVTVGQQAAWLAEAVALSSQSGKVKLVIVWNVDFTQYGTDPMAGYAMIRPGGGCPACNALAAAR